MNTKKMNKGQKEGLFDTSEKKTHKNDRKPQCYTSEMNE